MTLSPERRVPGAQASGMPARRSPANKRTPLDKGDERGSLQGILREDVTAEATRRPVEPYNRRLQAARK
jgi:hypothetical protein